MPEYQIWCGLIINVVTLIASILAGTFLYRIKLIREMAINTTIISFLLSVLFLVLKIS